MQASQKRPALTAQSGSFRLSLKGLVLKAFRLGNKALVLNVGRGQIADTEYTNILSTTVVEGRQNIRIILGDISGIRAHYESTVDLNNLGTFVSPLSTSSRTGFLRYTFVTARNIRGRTGSSSFRYNIFRKMVFES
jgi:hypothetical protein